MNGVSGGLCAKNKGLRAEKSKHDIPEDVRGQAGQEGTGQDEAVTRAAKDTKAGNTDIDVGMEVRSTAREHREQGINEECVMWSNEDWRMSAYSEVNIDAQEEPSEGKFEMKGDDTLRCLRRGDGRTEGEKHAAHEGLSPTCDRSDRESNRGTSTAD